MKKLLTLVMTLVFITSVFAGPVFFLPEDYTEVMPMRRSSTSSDIPERLHILLEELAKTDSQIKEKLDQISNLINKNWYLNSEFEKDRNIMLEVLRLVIEDYSNLNDRLSGLELELFNPEELGFDDMYKLLDSTNNNINKAYKELHVGKSGLKAARDAFGKGAMDYEKLSAKMIETIDKVKNAVPYNPQTPPAQTDEPQTPQVPAEEPINYNNLKVNIIRKHVKLNNLDIIKDETYEGHLVLKKSKERLHELDSMNRWLFRQAISGGEGYTFIIVKNAKEDYTIYWWHTADEIADIIDTIGDIFK